MAVTIAVADLQAALRLGDTAEVTRLLAYSTEAVTKHAPNAADTEVERRDCQRLG